MATPKQSENQIALAAEVRAIESGHHAFMQEDGSLRIVSDTTHDLAYVVRWTIDPGFFMHFLCECKAGQCRPHLTVPCWHSALAGRRLEREGIAVWNNGLFILAEHLQHTGEITLPDNLLEGLPQ